MPPLGCGSSNAMTSTAESAANLCLTCVLRGAKALHSPHRLARWSQGAPQPLPPGTPEHHSLARERARPGPV